MNKESLNEFYEADRFNKALRSRIDAHEPELSDSLWDRIEHDLNKRESKNRRALAWVYVLSGLLVLSAGAMYYLWNENQKLADNSVVVTADEANQNKAQNQVNPANNNGAVESINQTETAESSAPVTDNVQGILRTPSQRALVNTQNANATVNDGRNPSTTNGVNVESSNDPAIDPILANLNGENAENGEEPDMIGAEGELDLAPVKDGEAEASENSLNQKEPTADPEPKAKNQVKVGPQVFIGLQGGFNAISQNALSGNTEWLNLIEKPVNFTEYGLSIGVRFNNRIYLSSGLNSYSTGHAYSFDIVPTAPTPIPTPFPGADSIIAGDKYTLINRQNWIEVPVIVGYQYSLGKWSLNGEAGLSANFINSYSGSVPTPSYNKFDPDGTQNPNPYKNFLNMRAGLGFGYQLFEGFQVSAMANWRQALTYSSNAPKEEAWKASYAHRKPQSLGAQIRLTYTLK